MAVIDTPHRYVVASGSFAKARLIGWREGSRRSEREQNRIYAAQIQHDVAFRINAALQQHRWTQPPTPEQQE